jgi:hypothetical protein
MNSETRRLLAIIAVPICAFIAGGCGGVAIQGSGYGSDYTPVYGDYGYVGAWDQEPVITENIYVTEPPYGRRYQDGGYYRQGQERRWSDQRDAQRRFDEQQRAQARSIDEQRAQQRRFEQQRREDQARRGDDLRRRQEQPRPGEISPPSPIPSIPNLPRPPRLPRLPGMPGRNDDHRR